MALCTVVTQHLNTQRYLNFKGLQGLAGGQPLQIYILRGHWACQVLPAIQGVASQHGPTVDIVRNGFLHEQPFCRVGGWVSETFCIG